MMNVSELVAYQGKQIIWVIRRNIQIQNGHVSR